ncbi:hemerythrin domain-containing protein [Sphingomonas ginkgonis]|uniref:Hemerythrin domain-containing protein n=1 Tax=Sphingomonas ginkgonis TaxID=2315330 RepID=A0A429V8P1_9SPHN|nr:hemerythrin domain-containing protein [Sphingomonas ginkgonis]RST30319.1 hemerythrin domain-containing protein [Sphingomonas ginkgonis]
MPRTATLKNQHDAAEALVVRIKDACRTPPSDAQAFQISLMLAKLTGLLRIHFAQEDEILYPFMEAASDETAARTARAFREEMGGLSATYAAFAERWRNSREMTADFPAFRRECDAVFAALAERIARENRMLYPLADALSADLPHAV